MRQVLVGNGCKILLRQLLQVIERVISHKAQAHKVRTVVLCVEGEEVLTDALDFQSFEVAGAEAIQRGALLRNDGLFYLELHAGLT